MRKMKIKNVLNYLFSLCLIEVLHSWGADEALERNYRSACQKAIEEECYFAQFKSDPDYRQILEHVEERYGQAYLNIIREQSPEFLENIDSFKKNDLFGGPMKAFYRGIGPVSPTTLRYLKIASDLKKAYGTSLNQKSIVEIGGGYGGQCLILTTIYDFKNYTIVDIPEPLALTKKYLEKHGIYNVTYKNIEDSFLEEDFDLVISNYAYSELNSKMRKKYADEIINRSKRGYFTGFLPTVVEYFDGYAAHYKVQPENPSTHSTNVNVTWDICDN
jgi:putative sugar O-methyltransferase